jgi:UDP-glucuronate decarboxylase
VHRALPQDDPRQRRPDISKAQQVLGWTPKIALDEGLGRTLSYFQDMLKNNSIRYKILSDQQF